MCLTERLWQRSGPSHQPKPDDVTSSLVEIGALLLEVEQEVPVVGAFVLEALVVRQRNSQQLSSLRNLQWVS